MSDVIRPGMEPAPVTEPTPLSRFSAVDWGAILAGVAVATAISFVMAAFGSGVGLSLASPYEGASPLAHAIALALWVLWVTVASYAAGGYVCGRLRRRNVELSRDEAELRDGAHGLTVWATAMILVALAAGTSLYSVGKAGLDAVSREGIATLVDYRVDSLMRGDGDNRGGVAAIPGTVGAADAADTRQIVFRIAARAQATGEISEEDHGYLVNVLASRTGLSPVEAEARVEAVAQELRNDRARAKEVADKARKMGVVTSFIAAAAMLLAAASAWGGAVLGGRHRDENLGLSALTRW